MWSGSRAADQVTEKYGDDVLFLPPVDFGHGPKIGGGSWQWGVSADCSAKDGARAFLEFSAIFLFYQYFSSIPKELDEAARVDGAGWFAIYRKIIMPLSGPAVATVAILTFLPAWNSYLWPLMVVQSEEYRPVMIGIQYFFQLDTSWGQVMAYASMITVPVLALFLAFQRAFIGSIASSGVKG